MPAGIRTGFNYAVLDDASSQTVKAAAEEIRRLDTGMVEASIEIGRKLAAVKSVMANRNQWSQWVWHELRWDHGRVNRLIRVAAVFGDAGHVERFTFAALLELTGKSVPEQAIVQALERAAAGETINRPRAREIIDRLRPRKPRPETITQHRKALTRFVRFTVKRWPAKRHGELAELLRRLAAELASESESPAVEVSASVELDDQHPLAAAS